MPYIRSSMVHVPRPAPKRGDKARAAYQRFSSSGRARGVRSRFHNLTSKPAARGKKGNKGKMGSALGRHKSALTENRISLGAAGTTGLAFGTAGGILATSPGESKLNTQIRGQRQRIAANKKKLNVEKLFRPKNPYHLITEKGTRAERVRHKAEAIGWNKTHAKVGLTGVGAGVGLGGYAELSHKKRLKQESAKNKRTLASQRVALGKRDWSKPVTEFSKKATDPHKSPKVEPKYTTGRAATATLFGGFHSAIAGKRGKKLRSTGRSVGYSVGGNVLGSAAGLALTRGRGVGAARALGSAGSYTGNYKAFRASNKKGYYKQQSAFKKSASVSAFGVDHG